MKNLYFAEMRKLGIRYKKRRPAGSGLPARYGICPPYSEGQSFAFKFWAIADRYNADKIIVDELPCTEEVQTMLDTYKQAGIKHIVIKKGKEQLISSLLEHGCMNICETCVYSREQVLYNGPLMRTKGTLIEIPA